MADKPKSNDRNTTTTTTASVKKPMTGNKPMPGKPSSGKPGSGCC
jgi:hypothetical protein